MNHALSLGSSFFKAHGHGNDYLVFEEGPTWPVSEKTVRLVCHRNRGIGGDGIVAWVGVAESDAPRFLVRMFNPDGSEFERSGNGLRIFGAYLHSRGRVEIGHPFLVEVGGDVVGMEILSRLSGGAVDVAVDMGKAQFGIDAVGGEESAFGSGPSLKGPYGQLLRVRLVSVGNPHCVVFRDELREPDLMDLGPFLTSNPAFPAGTNVQLARVAGESAVEILIWERGVGRTASSGTSACAVASASVEAGYCRPGVIEVRMEGGSFRVGVSSEMDLRLEGPVQPVLEGSLAPGMLEGMLEQHSGGA